MSPQLPLENEERPRHDAARPDTDLHEAKAQLSKKDRMIATLTERLAETADQLDRLQRMGLDRGGKTTGGLPREIIEQQQLLTGKLTEFVQRWDEANTLDRLLRMEQGIEELLAAGQPGGTPAASFASQPAEAKSTFANASESKSPAGPSQGSFWEAAKARMLADAAEGASATEPPVAAESKPPVESLVAAHMAATAAAPQGASSPTLSGGELPSQPQEEPPAPQPISADATVEALHQAVDQRDAYIGFLVTRLRHAEERNAGPIDWEALKQAPEELTARLKQLEAQLKDQLARAEVVHSLERAALTRDRVRLQQVKQQLEQEIRRIGVKADKSEPPEKVEEKRFFRMIGRKK